MKKFKLFTLATVVLFGTAVAHPLPGSVVNLSVLKHSIKGEARIPLIELETALGMQADTNLNINTGVYKNYFLQHIKASSGNSHWNTSIYNITVSKEKDAGFGVYQQARIDFELIPVNDKDLRSFNFKYDAVMHQVITHEALIFLKEDWMNGIHEESNVQPLGVIKMNFKKGSINTLQVDLGEGSWWKGFASIISLGMQHIKEGTDHLLFLFVLLLPATLMSTGKRWAVFAGTKNSISRLIKIVTAFTIGHSVTLLLGAAGWVLLLGRFVETMIAVSILVSAIHALRPIFPGKEFFVAAGFGLVHGLAFASVLSSMNLNAGTLAVSILGFNIGIEVMQLFIITLVMPWLLLLSKLSVYKHFRVSGAVMAIIAAIAWITQRLSGKANFITDFIDSATAYSIWFIAALAITSIAFHASYYLQKKKQDKNYVTNELSL